MLNLHIYFNIHVCPFLQWQRCPVPLAISGVVSQNVTNKSCLVRVKSKEYAPKVGTSK